jgi:N-acetylmuramic acid 6-phosphate etherase
VNIAQEALLSKSVFEEIKNLTTEGRNPATRHIDEQSISEILHLINDEDLKIAAVVRTELPHIEQAVVLVVQAFKQGGRLFYVGAGTSGRLGVLDASECPPTFGVSPDLVQGIIAGGFKALVSAQEGAEDRYEVGAEDLLAKKVTPKDVICGIAASRRTPYVIGAIDKAREIGCKTLYVTCNPRSEMNIKVDVAICAVVGPEVIMGSTRMKAGTATKLILNMITTTAMIQLGKVWENMMVDLQMTSKKLEERSKKIVMQATKVDYEKAEEVLKLANGHVKTALVMITGGVTAAEARELLNRSDGFVHRAIAQNKK